MAVSRTMTSREPESTIVEKSRTGVAAPLFKNITFPVFFATAPGKLEFRSGACGKQSGKPPSR